MSTIKKILVIMGTRPEAIKLLPVVQLMKDQYKASFEVSLVSTGQHAEMIRQILNYFGSSPDIELNLMQPNQTLTSLTAVVLASLDRLYRKEKPDLVIVQGDTSTAFTAALAGFYSQIPVAHVEAGLRTYDKGAPYPEEVNRQCITRIADLHFAATPRNVETLKAERVPANQIMLTGNTVIDALLDFIGKIEEDDLLSRSIEEKLADSGYQYTNREILLVTGHRRESFGEGFKNICEALLSLAHEYPELDIVYPVHLNPNVHKVVHKLLSGVKNIYLIDPLDYASFVWLMNKSKLILTDSGGVQEEAPTLKKPVFVMRDTTERQEGVDAQLVKLVGTDAQVIFNTVSSSINSGFSDFKLGSPNPYGNGEASLRICEGIIDWMKTN